MDNRQRRTIDMFARVIDHLEGRPIDPPPAGLVKQAQVLVDIIARVRKLELQQSRAKRDGSATHLRHQRQRVLTAMRALVRIALPELAFAPGAERLLRLPHVRADAAQTARHASELAVLLAPHAELFADSCPPGYLDRLAADARTLAATAASAEAQAEGAIATAAIRREIADGTAAAKVMDGIMISHIGPWLSPEMELWRRARRIHARLGRPRARTGPTRSIAEQVAPS